MKQTLAESLKSSDLVRLIPRLEYYASGLLMKMLWRGHRLGTGSKGQLLAAGKSADDFVDDESTTANWIWRRISNARSRASSGTGRRSPTGSHC